MREQALWFAFFVALMFLLPPLVAMDLPACRARAGGNPA